jgi:ParB/RepB/Spo0J family partition protein
MGERSTKDTITANRMPCSAATQAPIIMVPIADIIIGVRRRGTRSVKTGLARLAESIQRRGLLHPILLRNGNELVAGHRRLEACRALGWPVIPARHADILSDEDFRAIELEENTERLDLDSFEQSRQRLAEIRQDEAKAKADTTAEELRGDSPHKSRGRPKSQGSQRSVAERTGISTHERQRVEQHVTLAETFPVFQRSGWRKHQVLRAGEALAAVPVKDQARVAHLIDQDALPPAEAIAIIKNIGTMPADERGRVLMAERADAVAKLIKAKSGKVRTKRPPQNKGKHHVSADKIMQNMTRALADLALLPESIVAIDELDATKCAAWANTMAESLRVLGRFVRAMRARAETISGTSAPITTTATISPVSP